MAVQVAQGLEHVLGARVSAKTVPVAVPAASD
jgi:hypothetical protein